PPGLDPQRGGRLAGRADQLRGLLEGLVAITRREPRPLQPLGGPGVEARSGLSPQEAEEEVHRPAVGLEQRREPAPVAGTEGAERDLDGAAQDHARTLSESTDRPERNPKPTCWPA